MTPLMEISYPLPSDAVWRKVYLRSGLGKKEKEYTQGWSLNDEPLCKLCQKQCMYVPYQSCIALIFHISMQLIIPLSGVTIPRHLNFLKIFFVTLSAMKNIA